MSDLVNDTVNSTVKGTANYAPDELAPLAARGDRFIAYLIDGVIAMVVALPLILHFGFFDPARAEGVSYLQIAGLIAYSLVAYLLIHGYFLAKSGQSLGKKAMSIRIVDKKTRKILPLHKVFLVRHLSMILLSIITLIQLIDALLIFRESKQTLHDLIADTDVIHAGLVLVDQS